MSALAEGSAASLERELDRDYFEAYVTGDPDVGRCIEVTPAGTRRWLPRR
jgi:hypothetical protein